MFRFTVFRGRTVWNILILLVMVSVDVTCMRYSGHQTQCDDTHTSLHNLLRIQPPHWIVQTDGSCCLRCPW